MRAAIILVLVSLIGYQQPPKIQGTYKYSYAKNSAYGLIKIHYKNPTIILFYLEANRGEPDYNSGSTYGRLTFNKKTGNYEHIPTDTAHDCKLILIKRKDKIIIKTVSGDCGFGYGVFADGNYFLQDSNNPQYFIDETDHKRFFDKILFEKYLY